MLSAILFYSLLLLTSLKYSGWTLKDEQTGFNAMKIFSRKAIPGKYATYIQVLLCHTSRSTIS